MKQALESGMDQVLAKPVTVQMMSPILKRASEKYARMTPRSEDVNLEFTSQISFSDSEEQQSNRVKMVSEKIKELWV